jgi:16S rRNA (cytidine1402-2'-O)-methyltransferase
MWILYTMETPGILYIVATPIGNLSDISSRALEVLGSVDVILCEDTRVTANLLTRYNVKKETKSYHHHSTDTVINEILELLRSGKTLACVSDAGTPGISDPGNILVSKVREALPECQIIPIPGASAVISALSVSGFPTDKFLFLGFPPHKKGRKSFFEEVKNSEYTVAFYESNHRIKKCIDELVGVLESTRQVVLCRELTKKFETTYSGTIEQIKDMNISEKGEFVVVVRGKR